MFETITGRIRAAIKSHRQFDGLGPGFAARNAESQATLKATLPALSQWMKDVALADESQVAAINNANSPKFARALETLRMNGSMRGMAEEENDATRHAAAEQILEHQYRTHEPVTRSQAAKIVREVRQQRGKVDALLNAFQGTQE